MSRLSDHNPFGRDRSASDLLKRAGAALAGEASDLLTSARKATGTEPRRSPAKVAAQVVGTAAVLGVGGLVAYWLRERAYAEAEYVTIRQDGPFSLRRYAPMVLATTETSGSMKDALDNGFRRLFDYISGKTRKSGGEEKIAMTVPVLSQPGEHPGAWKVGFVMPAGRFRSTLPEPERGVMIEERPGRLVAAVRFPGRITDSTRTAGRREDLIAWAKSQGLQPVGEAEFAGYNAPVIPGPARRNEWLLPVADTAVS